MSNLLHFAGQAPAIPDADDREQALDITRSFIVEAPAGSGKTALLIQRFLKLLASDSVTDPAQVLAITFTRKATHEMRDRVLAQLSSARRGEPPATGVDRATRPLAEAALANDRRHGWDLLDHPDRLNISTIDSLCIRLANATPVLSGASGLAPTERANELYAEAARRTLGLLGGEDATLTEALRTLLLHRDGHLADCESLIAGMLPWREQWANLIPLSGEQLTEEYLETVTRPRLESALKKAICRALTRLESLMPAPILNQLTALAEEMAYAEGYKGVASPIMPCKGLKQSPAHMAEDLEHWAALAHLLIKPSKPRDWRKATTRNVIGFEILKHHEAELKKIIAELNGKTELFDALCELTNLPPLRYPEEQWLVAKALFRVLSRALVELQLVFRERGECDFTEFSLIARETLHNGNALDDIERATGSRLEHLLVDEMQDTSNSQYDLIRGLTQSWDGHSQTVFLVGDPKQSIYLFRQAQVARFLETMRSGRLGEVPLTPLYLTANFRSQKNLVESFNEAFSVIFPPSSGVLDEVSYREAHAARPQAEGPDLVWHTSPISNEVEDKAAEHLLQLERNAAQIRDLIDQWRARPLPPGRDKPWRIAILGRSRRHLHQVTKAFEPWMYQAIDVVPLGERREILDLVSLTRALLHPADRTAWLALLRTPWCGLTLADLHLLTGEDDEAHRQRSIFEVVHERGTLLSDDGIERLQPFWTAMEAALAQRGRLPLSQWVSRSWQAFAADAFLDETERANAARFFELLDELEAAPEPVSIDRLDQRLEDLYATPATANDQVQMMTIHGAKGLEWDFVIVPQLESGSGKTGNRLLSWVALEEGDENDESVAHGIIAPVQPKGKESQALNRWMRSIDTAREAAERKRLFYVACTRAREELHLFAAPERATSGEIKTRHDSLLRSAWPAAERRFAELEQQEPGVVTSLAAAPILVPAPAPRTIQRIPLEGMPASFPTTRPVLSIDIQSGIFQRPEGGFEARAFGNAMHTFLELLTTRITGGATVPSLLAEVSSWSPRVSAILRAGGLAPSEIPRAANNVLRGLTRTLEDPDGQWLLAVHPGAATEATFATGDATIRLDRSFLAGPAPRSTGETHLWIVDYKTGTHGTEGLEGFLAKQRELYAPQLEGYAQYLAPRGLPIRLALYYPTLAKLLWWSAATDE